MTDDQVRGAGASRAWLGDHGGNIAWLLAALAVGLGLLLFGLLATSSDVRGVGPEEVWQAIPVLVFFLISPVVGALIVSRARGNPIGWVFIVCSGALAFGLTADTYAVRAIGTDVDDTSRATLVRWLGNWLSVPAFAALPLFALLFPDGRPPSPRWRPVIWTTLVGGIALVLSEALRPEVLIVIEGSGPQVLGPNPLGNTTAIPFLDGVGMLGVALILGSAVLGTVGLVVRFRRSLGVERQQLKWFVLAMGALVIMLATSATLTAVAGGATDAPGAAAVSEAAWILTISSLVLLPTAAGVAILRYRLYDIDVLINRALVYGALTVTLGGAYVGSVLLLQAVLRSFTAENEIAVAVSTLAVVALFQPLRSRIQDLVDRRFYRSRYDAQRTLDAFSARLRDEVDLGSLERDLIDVVADTVRPRHASLWLRLGASFSASARSDR